uniref:Uncharacterized protein n=1 Tax=Salix viminalis TaxID=40686 RepID=A0A6N2MS46_SALVM
MWGKRSYREKLQEQSQETHVDHQVDHAHLSVAVAAAAAQVIVEVEATADQDLHHQRESEVLRMRTGH